MTNKQNGTNGERKTESTNAKTEIQATRPAGLPESFRPFGICQFPFIILTLGPIGHLSKPLMIDP